MKYSLREQFYKFVVDEYKLYYISPFVDEISEFIEKNGKDYRSVLDFGCGYGELSQVFHQSGFEVTGMDMDDERINEAKIKYPDVNFMSFCYQDSLPFPSDSFDIIFSSSVLQYIDHEIFFTECKRILKKGGCIIFIENLKNNPITRIGRAYLKLKRFKYHSYPWNHLDFKSIDSLNDYFLLDTVKTYHIFGPLLYISGFKFLKPVIRKIDKILINIRFAVRASWLVLIIGKK